MVSNRADRSFGVAHAETQKQAEVILAGERVFETDP